MKIYKVYQYSGTFLGSVYLKDATVHISAPTPIKQSKLAEIIHSIQEEGLFITKNMNNATVVAPKMEVDDEYMMLLKERLVKNLLLVKVTESSSHNDKMI